jgi:hypothetical protein
MLGGITDSGELGQPDLLRKVVDGIAKLRHHASRGVEVLPPEVQVKIAVVEGSFHVIERFVKDPAFDREVEAELKNRLVRVHEDRMPVRHYVVEPGPKTRVEVTEIPPRPHQLRVEGGDRDGSAFGLPGEKRTFLIGRGQWHGTDQQVANDVIVADAEKSVSRRAARLHRTGGGGFELESLDQAEALVVRRPDGQRLRPALSANGRVPLRRGDVIEFMDGARPVLSVHVEEA